MDSSTDQHHLLYIACAFCNGGGGVVISERPASCVLSRSKNILKAKSNFTL